MFNNIHYYELKYLLPDLSVQLLQVDRVEEPPPPLKIDVTSGSTPASRDGAIGELLRQTNETLDRLPAVLERLEGALLATEQQLNGLNTLVLSQRAEAVLIQADQTMEMMHQHLDRYLTERGPVDQLFKQTHEVMVNLQRHLDESGNIDQIVQSSLIVMKNLEELSHDKGPVADLIQALHHQVNQAM